MTREVLEVDTSPPPDNAMLSKEQSPFLQGGAGVWTGCRSGLG